MKRVMFAAALLLLCIPFVTAGDKIDHCFNGPEGTSACNWKSGNLGGSDARYWEGMSVPYRLVLYDIPATSGEKWVSFGHANMNKGSHGYDFLTYWNQGNGERSIDTNDCQSAPATSPSCAELHQTGYRTEVDIPDDTFFFRSGDETLDRIQEYESNFGNRYITVWSDQPLIDPNITLSHEAVEGEAQEDEITVRLNWTGDASILILEFGTHLGVTEGIAEWGPGLGASYITGSAYHVGWKGSSWGSLGTQSKQIQSSAIIGPGNPIDEEPFCGDGNTDSGEECDDGDNIESNGCNTFCELTPICTGDGCESQCGDGVRDPETEQCDDDNIVSGDGCSASCTIEDDYVCVEETFGGDEEALTLPITYRDFLAWQNGAGHPNFQNENPGEIIYGIVEEELGSDGKPVFNGPTESTTTEEDFDQWYNDVAGVNIRIPRSITLNRISDGVYQYASSSFFPIDDAGWDQWYRDDTQSTTGVTLCDDPTQDNCHNFHFTDEFRYYFTYQGGETLTFKGDDDLWAFVDGKLAIDLGGVHGEKTNQTNLDDLDLTVGEIYEIAVFHAERFTYGSRYTLTIGGFEGVTSVCERPTEVLCQPQPPRYNLTDGPATFSFGDVFQLPDGPDGYTASEQSPSTVTVDPLDIATDTITTTANGLSGGAEVNITLNEATNSYTCPVWVFTETCDDCESAIACQAEMPRKELEDSASITFPLSDVFALGGTDPLRFFIEPVSVPSKVLLSVDDFTGDITADDDGLNDEVVTEVRVTNFLTGEALACPVAFFDDDCPDCEVPVCVSPTARVALPAGETRTLPFEEVFDFRGNSRFRYTASSSDAPRVSISTNIITNEINGTNVGLTATDDVVSGTVTLTDETGPVRTCDVEYVFDCPSCQPTCNMPPVSELLADGDTRNLTFEEVFNMNGALLSRFDADIVSVSSGLTADADTSIDTISIQNQALDGEGNVRVRITDTTGSASPTECTVNLFGLQNAPACNDQSCRSCTDYDCLDARSCLDGTGLAVINPYSSIDLRDYTDFELKDSYEVQSFKPMPGSGFTIKPDGNQLVSQAFRVEGPGVDHGDVDASRAIITIPGFNGEVHMCPYFERVNYDIGDDPELIDTDLLVTGSRVVSQVLEDGGNTVGIGPYIWTAKVWVR